MGYEKLIEVIIDSEEINLIQLKIFVNFDLNKFHFNCIIHIL